MEKESFEDKEVADFLNEHFVSIKVDREERPDIDNLYMSVCQALTGSGGWPLTVLLTPDQKPFYAGTYFPKRRMMGRIGLMDVLTQIQQKWSVNSESISEMSEQIVAELQSKLSERTSGAVDEELLHRTYRQFEESFDPEYGGFGSEPKFPSPHILMFLMNYGKVYQEPKALEMAEKTLTAMYQGGLYDHIGFGFSRYATDERWLIPHFEKMLYDNALLAIAYLEAYQLTEKQLYAEIAESIFDYVLRDMTSPEGAFYSAEDADSEGEEGKFYVFTREEIEDALGVEEMHRYCNVYGIEPEGNFEGKSIPNLLKGLPEDQAERRGMNPLALRNLLEQDRKKLFDYREKRVHPFKDDKVLTAWNGLMIAALARGAKALQSPKYAEAARNAADYVWSTLRDEEGRLLSRYRDGEVMHKAHLDDYAYLAWGLTELYEATGQASYLSKALELKEALFSLFWDSEGGGFYFTGDDHEQLLIRNKEFYDGALPSGNSVLSMLITKWAAITQDTDLYHKGQQLLQVIAGEASYYPGGHAMYMLAVSHALKGGTEIIISGKPGDIKMQEMISIVQKSYTSNASILIAYEGEAGDELKEMIPDVNDKPAISGEGTAYICRNFTCQAPVTTTEELREKFRPVN
ncbi:thioredoxin domain-containing protein [Neobacillus mesonae]|nr:thioredoxin domain-containing protein [Neobacillus mesonae]